MSRLEKAELAFAKLFRGSFQRTFVCSYKGDWEQVGDLWVRTFCVSCRYKNKILTKIFKVQFHTDRDEILGTSLTDEILV